MIAPNYPGSSQSRESVWKVIEAVSQGLTQAGGKPPSLLQADGRRLSLILAKEAARWRGTLLFEFRAWPEGAPGLVSLHEV